VLCEESNVKRARERERDIMRVSVRMRTYRGSPWILPGLYPEEFVMRTRLPTIPQSRRERKKERNRKREKEREEMRRGR
jgi:hypothetical protein